MLIPKITPIRFGEASLKKPDEIHYQFTGANGQAIYVTGRDMVDLGAAGIRKLEGQPNEYEDLKAQAESNAQGQQPA